MVIDDCVVVNLSTVRLTTDQLDLLALGPQHCPTSRSLTASDCCRTSRRVPQDPSEGLLYHAMTQTKT